MFIKKKRQRVKKKIQKTSRRIESCQTECRECGMSLWWDTEGRVHAARGERVMRRETNELQRLVGDDVRIGEAAAPPTRAIHGKGKIMHRRGNE